MEVAQARHVLGVGDEAEWTDVRAAFRRLVRTYHPDVAGPAGGARVTQVIEAYATLDAERRQPLRPSPPPRPSQPSPPAHPDTAADGDTVSVGAPRHEVFFRVLEAAHELGEVTYVDPNIGLIEVIVEFVDWPTCSLVVTLQGRATGVTEAWCTLESLGQGPAPPVGAVALLLSERMNGG